MGIPLEAQSPKGVEQNAIATISGQNNNDSVVKNVEDAEASGGKKRTLTSPLEAATHLFKGSVGAGLFAMGDCFKNGGLLGATILLPVICVICVHCERMLIGGSVLSVERTKGAITYDYPETVEKCFEYGTKPFRRMSKPMKFIVEMFLCVTQFGFCSVYFVFLTENLVRVLAVYGIDWGFHVSMCLCLLPVMIPSLLTNLKYISPVSAVANFALIFGLVATLWIALQGISAEGLAERHLTTNGSQMALFFGTALFSYEGIALILPLRNSMRNPEKFTSRFGVLNVTMLIITFTFIFTGFVSYTRWGEEVDGSITLNLDSNNKFSQSVQITSALGVFFGYPIQFFIMMKILWPPIKQSSSCAQKYPITAQVIFRFIMILMTFGVALLVPNLHLFISLIGAFCSTALALVFPVLIDFAVRSHKTMGTWIFLKNMAILVIAAVGIVTGTYESINQIVKVFKL